MKTRPFPQSAFTLVELLVSIAVVGVLISILSVALVRARSASKATQSMVNLRQIGAAGILFAGDNANALLPYRLERGVKNPGMWYDMLNQYFGREPGKAGRNVGADRQHVEVFYCPVQERTYAINRICGWGDGTTGMAAPLKRGQGVLPNSINSGKPQIFELPGGLNRTAWFSTANGGDFASQYQRDAAHVQAMTFPHDDHAIVLMMDGSVIKIRNPHFARNPDIRTQSEWVDFFGYYVY